ncbi:SRPBCC family protein [Kribbella sp. CA-294648]|uniref:SRPBCC family protein n=1 Tax=Kribbella sp. CA-294648 TaxID=3239948 RepID=UPI003D94B01D
MIFTLLFYSDEKAIAAMSQTERNRLVEAHVAYNFEFLSKRCTVLASRALMPTATATTVWPDSVTPGPAVVSDPPLTGFYLIDCADQAEAVELARGYPMPADLGRIEVRAVIQEWDYAPSVETTASPDAIWSQYADVASWPEWKHQVERVELDGPLATGITGRIVIEGRPPMPYRIVSATPGRGYVSETELGEGIVLRIEHVLTELPDGGTRITHRVNVPRAALDLLGHEFSPALNDGMRRTLHALAERVATD